jgi:hypothetical protein
MPPAVQVGAILIEEGPLTTQLLGLETEPYSGNWSLVKVLDGFALDRRSMPRDGTSFSWQEKQRRCSSVQLGRRRSRAH